MNTANRTRHGYEATSAMAYRGMHGDTLLQDIVLQPEVVREIQQILSKSAGELAFSPEIHGIVMNTLARRYETDQGNDLFVPPNYAPYEDKALAAFYGIETTGTDNIQTRMETFEEKKKRIIQEVAREVEPELAGLVMIMKKFDREEWARYGMAEEAPYVHVDPDVTLFDNPGREWCAADRSIATNDKGNVIDMYDAFPDYTFPRSHPGWNIDRAGGFYETLK